jgi:GT2 family glycosyltransferase
VCPLSLAIVIPSYNRPDLLGNCLRAVTRHAPPGTEIIVVDDGSPQGQASSVATSFAGVRPLRLNRRRDFCTAVNAGIRAAQSSIVELLNDDAEVTAGWAEPALSCFQDSKVAAVAPLVLCKSRTDLKSVLPGEAVDSQDSKVAAVAPLVLCKGRTDLKSVLPGEAVDSAGDRYYIGGIAGKRGHGQPLDTPYLERRRVFGVSASAGFYRRDALLRVGGFPEDFRAYFEDVDVAFRLHWAGYQLLFEPASRVYHHISSSYGRPSRRLLEQQSRNEESVFWRNLPTRDLLRALPLHLAVLLAKAGRRMRRGELLPFLCGRLSLLGEVPSLLYHRRWLRQLGSTARLSDWEVEPRFWGLGPTR